MITVLLAGLCNSVMDTVDHHFHDSVFSLIKDTKKRLWWNEDKGWLNKYNERDVTKGLRKIKVLGMEFNYPVQITDSWHTFKSVMLVFLALALPEFLLYYLLFHNCEIKALFPVIGSVCFGISWILGFNVGYNKLLLKKTWGL